MIALIKFFLVNSLKRVTVLFWLVLILTFIIKIYLVCLVPITGDEAQYVYWGQHLSWGYYDHPPMIGWWLAAVTKLGLSNFWLRFCQISITSLIGYLIYRLLRPFEKTKACLIAILYLLTPFNLFNIGILTDTPLLLFSFLTVLFLFYGWLRDQYKYYALAGACFGAAFLSKYLIFPVALAILLYFVLTKKLQCKWRKFLLFSICALPFFLENILWNYYHYWVNFLFNLDLRNTSIGFHPNDVLLYVGYILYLYSPIVIYYMLANGKSVCEKISNKIFSIWIMAAVVPICFYLLLSATRSVGIHWIFCAYPFLFVSLFALLDREALRKCIKFMSVYTGIQLFVVICLFHFPLNLWEKSKHYNSINFFLNYQKIADNVKPYIDEGFLLITPSYSQSYLLSYKKNIQAAVWGIGSVHGRDDDLETNFSDFDGRNFLIVDVNNKLTVANIRQYFRRVIIKRQKIYATAYNIFFGYGFKYDKYRAVVLKSIFDKYYEPAPQLLKKIPSLGNFNWAQDYYKKKYSF